MNIVCRAVHSGDGLSEVCESVLRLCLPGLDPEISPERRLLIFEDAIRYSPAIGLPRKKRTRVLLDTATMPAGQPRDTAESLRDLLDMECQRLGFAGFLRTVIVSGHPVDTAARWAERHWEKALSGPSPLSWGAGAPVLNHQFAAARYLVKPRHWIGRLLNQDPVARDCIVATVPCGDELAQFDRALKIRLSIFRWELLQPIIVRFHAKRFLSIRLVRQVRRRLRARDVPHYSRAWIAGCCSTVQEVIVSVLQQPYWYPEPKKYATYVCSMLEFLNATPSYKGFENREILFAAIVLVALFDLDPSVEPAPGELYAALAQFVGAPEEDVRDALDEFCMGFRQLHFFHCELSYLARCVAGLMRCPKLAEGVFDHHPLGQQAR